METVAYANSGKWISRFGRGASAAQVPWLLAAGCCTLRRVNKPNFDIFARPEYRAIYRFDAHYKLPQKTATVPNEGIYVEADVKECGLFIDDRSMTYVSR